MAKKTESADAVVSDQEEVSKDVKGGLTELEKLIEDVKGIDSLDAPNQQKKLLALVLYIANNI